MPGISESAGDNDRVLIKLRPSPALGAAASRVNLRPLHDTPGAAAAAFGGILYAIVTGDTVTAALTRIIERALSGSV